MFRFDISSRKSSAQAGLLALAAALLLSACATRGPEDRAPVEDRGTSSRPSGTAPAGQTTPGAYIPPTAASGTTTVAKPPSGIENLGKPGYYQVRPGDTLIRIGLETGQSWRDIARWNNLDNPNILEVGQVIRIIAPSATTVATTPTTTPVTTPAPTPVASAPAPAASGVVTSPVTASPGVQGASLPPAGTTASGTRTATATAATPAPAPATSAPPVATGGDEDVGWIWPSAGTVIDRFDEAKNKGIDIGGKLGDPVIAAADGRVVYAGSGLRGYGNLVILKHNNTYLTAYAHNQTLLVKEDQTVRKGQKIAEMGSSDSDKVKLHFEIRRQGKPVDPLRFLPAR
jgi:lipoprotein NlpD